MKIGFDNEKYLSMQSEHIRERINQFDNKLYLEFGGKLFDDYHASRVLPGFAPDSKLRMLMQLADHAEIVIVISAGDIEKNKFVVTLVLLMMLMYCVLEKFFRSVDFMSEALQSHSFPVSRLLLISKRNWKNSASKYIFSTPLMAIQAIFRLSLAMKVMEKMITIETTRPLVVITAPGPGSGKMATCLSQLYHEHKRGVHAGYAKFETFPIWNIPLKHPVNLAYEAATADLNDVNMIDPFHLEAYGETTVNYNRDVEIFPVLRAIFDRIFGKCPYQSPTDMGVNMAGNCIIDDEACCEASRQEIIRRYYQAVDGLADETKTQDEVFKIELLMKQANISLEDRKVTVAAKKRAEETGAPAAAVELDDGRIITGKTSDLLGAASALLLNALKDLAGLPHNLHVISPASIEPIQKLKTSYLGSKNPRLHTDEILIALSSSAATSDAARLALEQLPKLKGCQVHSSVMLSSTDKKTFQKLKMQVTCEPVFERKNYIKIKDFKRDRHS